jgi:hypothetical protein
MEYSWTKSSKRIREIVREWSNMDKYVDTYWIRATGLNFHSAGGSHWQRITKVSDDLNGQTCAYIKSPYEEEGRGYGVNISGSCENLEFRKNENVCTKLDVIQGMYKKE